MRVLEQRLGRNTAPDQAGAAERLLLLDDRDALAQLRGADGGDIATRPRANDHHVECIRQMDSFGTRDDSRGVQRLTADSGTKASAGARVGDDGRSDGGTVPPGCSWARSSPCWYRSSQYSCDSS